MSEVATKDVTELMHDYATGKSIEVPILCCGEEECEHALWGAAFDIVRFLLQHPDRPVSKVEGGSLAEQQWCDTVLRPFILGNEALLDTVKTIPALEMAIMAAGILTRYGYDSLMNQTPQDMRIALKKVVN